MVGSMLWELEQLNRGFEIRYFDHAQSYEFLVRHLPVAAPIYQQQKKGMFKTDLIRLVLLFVLGGFYVDADAVPAVSFYDADTLPAWTTFTTGVDHTGVVNGFIGATPGHPAVGATINVTLGWYNNDVLIKSLCPSAFGPCLCRLALAQWQGWELNRSNANFQKRLEGWASRPDRDAPPAGVKLLLGCLWCTLPWDAVPLFGMRLYDPKSGQTLLHYKRMGEWLSSRFEFMWRDFTWLSRWS